ncbi:MAG: hypothetical protein NTX22_00305 [Ignavibacteriales bacterium]|nr:hypothetical protein [Ignavibacteriales bacterium]
MFKTKELEFLMQNEDLFFNFLKEKYHVFNNSNIFLRDIQYGVVSFFEKRDIKLNFTQVEKFSDSIILSFEEKNILSRLTNNTWKVNLSKENIVVKSEAII